MHIFFVHKALVLSSSARNQTTVGQIVNLMAVDAQRLQDIPIYISNILFAPPLVIICGLLMWQTLGVASLLGIAVLVLIFTPLNGVYVSNKIKKLQVIQLECIALYFLMLSYFIDIWIPCILTIQFNRNPGH